MTRLLEGGQFDQMYNILPFTSHLEQATLAIAFIPHPTFIMARNDNIQPSSLVATGLSLAIASVSVMLRFIARRMLRQRPFLDDWFMLAAVVSCFIELKASS